MKFVWGIIGLILCTFLCVIFLIQKKSGLYTPFKIEGSNMQRRKFVQNKLWRDKAPELMESTGSVIHTKELDDEQFAIELRVKLLEEVLEVQVATTQEELMGEIADVLEVLDTIMRLHKISSQDIAIVQQQKKEFRGGFDGRTFVTFAEHLPNSFGEKYCLKDPLKYPEILD